MSIDLTCRGCGAILDTCAEIPDPQLYTLENAGLPTLLSCPPGYACNQGNGFTLQCCNQQISVTFPNGATPAQKNSMMAALVQQCQVLMASCGGTKPVIYFNAPQTCTVLCPDGTPFSFTEQAGSCGGPDQNTANHLALAIACQQAKKNKVCPPKKNYARFYWTLDEPGASDDRVDSFQGFHLKVFTDGAIFFPPTVDNNGLYGKAVRFNNPTPYAEQFFQPAPMSTDFAYTRGQGMSWWCWIKANQSNAGSNTAALYWTFYVTSDLAGNTVVGQAVIEVSGVTFQVLMSDALNTESINSATNVDLTVGKWQMLAMKYDPSTKQVYCRINLNAWAASPLALVDVQSTPYGNLNWQTFGGIGLPYDWSMDEMGLVYTVLTDAQWSQIYNSGAGVTWPQIGTIV